MKKLTKGSQNGVNSFLGQTLLLGWRRRKDEGLSPGKAEREPERTLIVFQGHL